jgi:predicted transposase YdaD
LRYSPDVAARLFQGVISMKESSTYQAILEEGRSEGLARGAVAEAKKVLRLLGDEAFGAADPRTASDIEQISDLSRLEELLSRMRTAKSWAELLGRQPIGRRRKRAP